uniref:Serpentine receptor class gamma n=1 Tax=Caenorhabditis japonica TaxID=281687 RepID=A0A8R1HRK1_CAEJA
MRRELKLALQVFILVTAQIIILIFFALINIYSEPAQNETVMFIKTLTPYFYGLPSYFSPFTMIFFNREFSKQLRKMVTGRKMEVQVDTSVASSGLWKAGGSQNVRSLAVAPTSSRLQTARVNGSMTSITKI